MNGDRGEFERLELVKTERAEELLSRAGVTGVAVGYRKRGGARTDEPAIIVYVEKKKSLEDLSPQEVISIDGVEIDVQEHGPMVAHYLKVDPGAVSAQDTSHHRPLTGGVEIGPTGDHFVGTLGLIAFDIHTGNAVGLTNWHVAAGSAADPVGRGISQPGNGQGNKIGTCIRGLRGVGVKGDVDAASVSFDAGVPFAPMQVLGIGTVNGQMPASNGQAVVKQGRTTDRTTGSISSLGWTGNVNYDGILVRFTGQILIEPAVGVPAASKPGDSGSVWLSDPGHAAVGLNFAGDGRVAIANPFHSAIAAVGITTDRGRFAFYRWWNPTTGDHFYTQDASGELAPVGGYRYEGVGCNLLPATHAGAVALHRWFNPHNGDHFYTTDPTGELAPSSGYVAEGIAGYVSQVASPGLVAWNRWYSPGSGDHFYTTDPGGELAPTSGYRAEGIAGWVYPG